ncbi:MAG: D-aminoacyl-tRNA deacylase [Desulfobacterales bacterium]|jgi:D-tyrosyl-tRNA(Tyr) deacylase
MRVVIQRVKSASVVAGTEVAGRIGKGLLVLLGVAISDNIEDAEYLADKTVNLRIFEDENQKMNRSLLDIGGEILVVSQFTLLGDCKKGRRPSFVNAAPPELADKLYRQFVDRIRQKKVSVKTGRFQANMAVSLINDGPVTLIIDSK